MRKFDTAPRSTLGEELNDTVNVFRELGANEETVRRAVLAQVFRNMGPGQEAVLLEGFPASTDTGPAD